MHLTGDRPGHEQRIGMTWGMYQPDAEAGIYCKDQILDITWPLPVANLSHRDNSLPSLTHNFTGIEV